MEHSAEKDVPKGMWAKASLGWQKWGLWHYVPDRISERGWQGYGVTAICGASLYRRTDFGVRRQRERPADRLCSKCASATPPEVETVAEPETAAEVLASNRAYLNERAARVTSPEVG